MIRTFPGPAYGPLGLREKTGFAADQPAFGTILKPTAGITPEEVGQLVEKSAGSPLLVFIKEDEDLYPELDYSPVGERTVDHRGAAGSPGQGGGTRTGVRPAHHGRSHEFVRDLMRSSRREQPA